MDANALEKIAHQKVAEICQKKNILMTPEKIGLKSEPFSAPPSWKASLKIKFDFILDRIKKQEDGMGRNLSHIFQNLPTKIELPEYYKVIKRPMDLDKVQTRVRKIAENAGYPNMEEFMDELLLVFENATSYNEPGSIIYQDALILHKVAIDSLHIVENGNPNDQNPAFKIQDPQSALQVKDTNFSGRNLLKIIFLNPFP
jgi:protein polybromo-1